MNNWTIVITENFMFKEDMAKVRRKRLTKKLYYNLTMRSLESWTNNHQDSASAKMIIWVKRFVTEET